MKTETVYALHSVTYDDTLHEGTKAECLEMMKDIKAFNKDTGHKEKLIIEIREYEIVES